MATIAPDDVVAEPVVTATFRAPPPRPRATPERVAPVADADELADLFLRLVEEADDPIEVERLLDGVLRLASERPADAGVLLRRATAGEFWANGCGPSWPRLP